MLRVEHLVKRFGATLALDDVSLQVERGELVGFLGPNGSGKTTTMRAVMGLIGLDGGEVSWDDGPIGEAERRRFGYMPAERGMYPKMGVRDQIVYFARLAGQSKAEAAASADHWLERLGLLDRRGDEVQALSSGNQQRVQLAIALVHRPELLILDEPFSGLDPLAVEVMKAMLQEQVDAGTAVLFSSHQLDLVADVCRSVVIVDRGRVVLEGDVRALRERSAVRYVEATFTSEPAVHHGELDGLDVVAVGDRMLTARVDSSIDASTVLDRLTRLGDVSAFSFGPPELSEVFVDAVGSPTAATGSAGR